MRVLLVIVRIGCFFFITIGRHWNEKEERVQKNKLKIVGYIGSKGVLVEAPRNWTFSMDEPSHAKRFDPLKKGDRGIMNACKHHSRYQDWYLTMDIA